MKALVVEDDNAVRALLCKQLTALGFITMEAASIEDATYKLDTDLIVLDMFLPNGHGLALLRELRKTRDDIPVVCVSAWPDSRSAALAAPLTYWVDKPYLSENFVGAVKEARVAAEALAKLREGTKRLSEFNTRGKLK
jgi:DNA-binding response OmpR family regulator